MTRSSSSHKKSRAQRERIAQEHASTHGLGSADPGAHASDHASSEETGTSERRPRRAFTIFVSVLCVIMLGCMTMLWYYG